MVLNVKPKEWDGSKEIQFIKDNPTEYKFHVEVIASFDKSVCKRKEVINKGHPHFEKMYNKKGKGFAPTRHQWICWLTLEGPPSEFFVLSHIIDQLKEDLKLPMHYLVKLSLCYMFEGILDEDDGYKNLGFNFIHRTNSKYYFQPDQRDDLEECLCEVHNIAGRTEAFRLKKFKDEEIGDQAMHQDELVKSDKETIH